MFVNKIFLASNPFIEAYTESDFLGKMIFISLYALSICSWILIFYKGWNTYLARKYANLFYKAFESQRMNPLNLDSEQFLKKNQPNPFSDLYSVLKKHTIEILKKNRQYTQQISPKASTDSAISYMSPTDIDFVQSHLMTTIAHQTKILDKNLFILSTIVSLAPFLGLLGTVWGILSTFSEMQTSHGGGQHMVLGGISLALATTVLGLIDAIPALIGYSYLKNNVRDFQIEMEGFSHELLASVEMYYRQVDVA